VVSFAVVRSGLFWWEMSTVPHSSSDTGWVQAPLSCFGTTEWGWVTQSFLFSASSAALHTKGCWNSPSPQPLRLSSLWGRPEQVVRVG